MARNSRHLRRHLMPVSWGVKRKGISFVARPNPGSHQRAYATSLLNILRDNLNYAHSTKEAKYITHNEEIKVNGKQIKDIKTAIGMFDLLEIPKTKEKYTVIFDELGKIKLVPAKDDSIVLKVSNKTRTKGGKFQINFMNGFNILVDEKTFKSLSVEDSVLYDFTKKKVSKTFALKEGAFVYVYDGKFQGQIGQIESITEYNGKARDVVFLKIGKESHSTAKDYCFVIGSKKEDVIIG